MSEMIKRRPRLSFRGLTFQLFVLTILPLTGLLLVITFGSLDLHNQAMRRMVGERDMLAVHTASAALVEQAEQRSNTLHLLASRIPFDHIPASSSQLAELVSSYDFLNKDFDRGLAILKKDGAVPAIYGEGMDWPALVGPLYLHRQKILGDGPTPTILANQYTDAATGKPVVIFLALLADRDSLLAGAVTVDGLAGGVFNGPMLEGHHTSFTVVNTAGETVYQAGYRYHDEQAGAHSGIVEALNGESGTTFQQVGAGEHVVAYSPVPAPLHWGLISEEPWEMVDSPTLRFTQSAPLILVPALFLALVALGFALRQIVRPLRDLEARAGQLARGDFDAITAPVGGIEEIRSLQAGLSEMAQQLKTAQRSLHSYIGAITSAQEDERRRLARELHDDTIQALIALKQRVDLARMDLHRAGAGAPLDEIAGLTEETIANLRRLTRALRPIYLEDLGLATALEMLALEAGQAAGIPVTFELQGKARRLAPEVELALYRIAQEALNNLSRHARAASAQVRLRFDRDSVGLEVADDGIGFQIPESPSGFTPGGHYGLLGMYERAELIGARLEIVSTVGGGTRLIVRLSQSENNHQ